MAAAASPQTSTTELGQLKIRYPGVLAIGGDKRIQPDSVTGLNSYGCGLDPEGRDVIFRGSSTCNLITREADVGVRNALKALTEKNFDDKMSEIRQRLANALQLPEGSGVFLTRSGTDSEYVPLLVAQAVYGQDSKICNVVTCMTEIGSKSDQAAAGNHFGAILPLKDEIAGTVGDSKPEDMTGISVKGFENVSLHVVNARDVNGIVNTLAEADVPDVGQDVTILHSVIGSKTGIRIQCAMKPTEDSNIISVTDACQMRDDIAADINGILKSNEIAMITGSKFFRAPPFCGAVIVPSTWMKAIRESKPPTALHAVFDGPAQIPEEMRLWRKELATTAVPNYGLYARWMAALVEMEPLLKFPADVREKATMEWRSNVMQNVVKYENLKVFDQGTDCPGVVCVDVFINGNSWPKAKLKKQLFFSMAADSPICYIGQPVAITKDRSIIRIALGADRLRMMLQSDEAKKAVFEEDVTILLKVETIRKKLEREEAEEVSVQQGSA